MGQLTKISSFAILLGSLTQTSLSAGHFSELDPLLGDTPYHGVRFSQEGVHGILTYERREVLLNKQRLTLENDTTWCLPSSPSDPQGSLNFQIEDASLLDLFKTYIHQRRIPETVPCKHNQQETSFTPTAWQDDEVHPVDRSPLLSRNFSLTASWQEPETHTPHSLVIHYTWRFTKAAPKPASNALSKTSSEGVVLKGMIFQPTYISQKSRPTKIDLYHSLWATVLDSNNPLLFPLSTQSLKEQVSYTTVTPHMLAYDPEKNHDHPLPVHEVHFPYAPSVAWQKIWHPRQWGAWTQEDEKLWNKLVTTSYFEMGYRPISSVLAPEFRSQTMMQNSDSTVTTEVESGDAKGGEAAAELTLTNAKAPLLPKGLYTRTQSRRIASESLFKYYDGSYTAARVKEEIWLPWTRPSETEASDTRSFSITVHEDTGLPVSLLNTLQTQEPDPMLSDYVVIMDPVDVDTDQTIVSDEQNTSDPEQKNAYLPQLIPVFSAQSESEGSLKHPTTIINGDLITRHLSPSYLFLDLMADTLFQGLHTLHLNHIGLFQLSSEKLALLAQQLKKSSLTSLSITECFPKKLTPAMQLAPFLTSLLAGNQTLSAFQFDNNYMDQKTFVEFATLVRLSSLKSVSFRLPDEPSTIKNKYGAIVMGAAAAAYGASVVATGGLSLAVGAAAVLAGTVTSAAAGAGATKTLKAGAAGVQTLVHRAQSKPNAWVLECFSHFQIQIASCKRHFIFSNNPEPSTWEATLAALQSKYSDNAFESKNI